MSCRTCEKPITKHPSGLGRPRLYCSSYCKQRGQWKLNPDGQRTFKVTQAESQRRRRAKWRAIMDAAKDVPCVDCGVKYPPAAMDFDHVRGDKEHNIGTLRGISNTAQLQAEIAKCDVRCANCHRLRHWLENAQSDDD